MLPKLLILTSTFPRWRGDNEPPFVYELSRRLSQRYEVHILAPHAPQAATYEKWDGLHIHRFRYFFTKGEKLAYNAGILTNLKQNKWRYFLIPCFIFSEGFALYRLLKQYDFAVIHAHWIIPQGLVAWMVQKFFKTPPILLTSHGSDLNALDHPWLRKLKSDIIAHCQGMTVVSQAMRDKVLSLVTDNPAKFAVIPMGVELHHCFIPAPSRRQANTLLYVGRLIPNKGVDYLLSAFIKVVRTYADARLTIIGSGPQLSELQTFVKRHEIEHAVQFLGAVDNQTLPKFYQQSEIVIFPSVAAEGFGLVLVEALGCECAVIATDLPAVRDILQDKKTAMIVKQREVDELAQTILFLLENVEVRQELGKAGRDFVLQRYDWETITHQYVAILRSLEQPSE